jgi:hypothetical protein
LDERDRAILRTLAAVRLARGDQLRRLHLYDVDPRSARRTLARLHRLKLVIRLERRIGGQRKGSDGSLYQLSAAGLRLVRPGRSARTPWRISEQFQDHILAVTELLTGLAAVHRARLVALSAFETEAVRRFAGPHGQVTTLKADAFVRLDGTDYFDVYFVEVDLDTESPTTIRRKAETYYAYYLTGREQATYRGVFPKVIFLARTERRVQELSEALAMAPQERRRLFGVGLLGEAVMLLVGGGPEPADGGEPGAAA